MILILNEDEEKNNYKFRY